MTGWMVHRTLTTGCKSCASCALYGHVVWHGCRLREHLVHARPQLMETNIHKSSVGYILCLQFGGLHSSTQAHPSRRLPAAHPRPATFPTRVQGEVRGLSTSTGSTGNRTVTLPASFNVRSRTILRDPIPPSHPVPPTPSSHAAHKPFPEPCYPARGTRQEARAPKPLERQDEERAVKGIIGQQGAEPKTE